jgi:hypothetical protein
VPVIAPKLKYLKRLREKLAIAKEGAILTAEWSIS